MVLIFAETTRQVKAEMKFSPFKNFRIVKDVNCIRGQTFTGVIMMYGWWKNESIQRAKESLEYRQPELFEEHKDVIKKS